MIHPFRYKAYAPVPVQPNPDVALVKQALGEYNTLPTGNTATFSSTTTGASTGDGSFLGVQGQSLVIFVYDAGAGNTEDFTSFNVGSTLFADATTSSQRPHHSALVGPAVLYSLKFRFFVSVDGVTFSELPTQNVTGLYSTVYLSPNDAFSGYWSEDASSPYYVAPKTLTFSTSGTNPGTTRYRCFAFIFSSNCAIGQVDLAYAATYTTATSVTASVGIAPDAPCPTPSAPLNVLANPDHYTRSTLVIWDAVTGATGYIVRRDGTVAYRGTRLQWRDAWEAASGTGGASPKTPAHVYSVAAFNACGEGAEACTAGAENA